MGSLQEGHCQVSGLGLFVPSSSAITRSRSGASSAWPRTMLMSAWSGGTSRARLPSAAGSTSKVSGLEQGFGLASVLLYALGEGGLERRGNGSREGRRRCHDVCAYAGRAQPERRLGRGHPASKGQALCCPFPEQW